MIHRAGLFHDLQFLVQQGFAPECHQGFGTGQAGRVLGADGLDEALLQDDGQTAGGPLDLTLVDADAFRVSLADDAPQAVPLTLRLVGVPGLVVPGVLVKPFHIGAGDVEPLDGFIGAPVVKDQDLGDGAPVFVGDHRLEDRVVDGLRCRR